jgi:hypothetical protein
LISRLGAIVVNGQNLAGNATQFATTTAGAPSPPPQAYLPDAKSPRNPLSGSCGIGKAPSKYFEAATTHSTAADLNQQVAVKKKFLEICVRSSKTLYTLGEIDVSGHGGISRTDRDVFERIKAKYEAIRTSVRIFGRFALHEPNAGNFVKVRWAETFNTTAADCS